MTKKSITEKVIFYSPAVLALLLVMLTNFSVRAHDYWFEADNFFPAENASVTVHMLVGTRLVVEEERPLQSKRTVFFKLISPDNIADFQQTLKDGTFPVVTFRAGKAGTYLLGKERNAIANVLDAQKFNEYLREENLTEVIAERARRGENEKFGYERYRRYIKSLIQVGNIKDATYRRQLGFKLEIVPLENPYSKKPGDSLKLKVLFAGQPLAGNAVFAYHRAAGKVSIEQRETNREGEFKIKLAQPGFWLVRLVKMDRCAQDCEETDWESYWGSLSFVVR